MRVVRVEDALAEALPGVRPRSLQTIDSGWDSVVLDVDGEWIVRVARRDAVAERYRVEAALLPELAAVLPLAVPVPVRVGEGWILTRRIDGARIGAAAPSKVGTQLGSFLRALHAFPIARARELGVGAHDHAAVAREFRAVVVPLLDPQKRVDAERLLAEYEAQDYEPAVVHMDLGPEHVLVEGASIRGVIDWTDVLVGDPAIDLAWALHGAPEDVARSVAEAYGVDRVATRRALVYHAIGPWHEVVWGLRRDTRGIESGLTGVRDRLRKVTGAPDTMAR